MEQEKPIANVSERKEAFFGVWKTTILKRPKFCIFPKGLDHGLCRKIKTFSNFSFNSKWSNKKCLVKFQKEWKSF